MDTFRAIPRQLVPWEEEKKQPDFVNIGSNLGNLAPGEGAIDVYGSEAQFLSESSFCVVGNNRFFVGILCPVNIGNCKLARCCVNIGITYHRITIRYCSVHTAILLSADKA